MEVGMRKASLDKNCFYEFTFSCFSYIITVHGKLWYKISVKRIKTETTLEWKREESCSVDQLGCLTYLGPKTFPAVPKLVFCTLCDLLTRLIELFDCWINRKSTEWLILNLLAEAIKLESNLLFSFLIGFDCLELLDWFDWFDNLKCLIADSKWSFDQELLIIFL